MCQVEAPLFALPMGSVLFQHDMLSNVSSTFYKASILTARFENPRFEKCLV
jgi:hypothetical protein